MLFMSCLFTLSLPSLSLSPSLCLSHTFGQFSVEKSGNKNREHNIYAFLCFVALSMLLLLLLLLLLLSLLFCVIVVIVVIVVVVVPRRGSTLRLRIQLSVCVLCLHIFCATNTKKTQKKHNC